MQRITPAVALIGALALLAVGLPAGAAAKTSAAPLHQQEPAGLLRKDDAREVARARDDAEAGTGRTIHMDVVVDQSGRRVTTERYVPVPRVGVGAATEVPAPVLAEDVNAPDGIVVLVDPFEGTHALVEAPGLTEWDGRYLYWMTGHFRCGSYDDDGLIAAAYGLKHRLVDPRPLFRPSDTPHRPAATERALSSVAVALFAGGTAAVILLLIYFLRGEGYRGPRGPDKGVAFVAARRDAEALLSALAPRVMLLAEKEMAVPGRLRSLQTGAPSGPNPQLKAEVLLRQAVSGGFWKDFVAATSLVQDDPETAVPELRRLSVEVEAVLGKLGEAEGATHDPRAGEGPGGGTRHLTREDENDG